MSAAGDASCKAAAHFVGAHVRAAAIEKALPRPRLTGTMHTPLPEFTHFPGSIFFSWPSLPSSGRHGGCRSGKRANSKRVTIICADLAPFATWRRTHMCVMTVSGRPHRATSGQRSKAKGLVNLNLERERGLRMRPAVQSCTWRLPRRKRGAGASVVRAKAAASAQLACSLHAAPMLRSAASVGVSKVRRLRVPSAATLARWRSSSSSRWTE